MLNYFYCSLTQFSLHSRIIQHRYRLARIEAIEEEYENGQYVDAEEFEKELTAQYPWLEDWKRSISIEDFRKNCKNKLNKLFP